MPSYKHFQSDNFKYDKKETRTDIYNPEFNNPVKSVSDKDVDKFKKNLNKWIQFVSWCRFYPDLFFDLITPQTGGIRLDLDQRVFLRCLARFISTYGVFPRGWGKTFLEVLGMYHAAIFYPDIEISMSAQTKENASKLLEEKHREILRYYPLIANEIVRANFSKDSAEVIFTSGGRIDILANQQSSKGMRRRRLNIEEAALLDNNLFKDVLEPIVNVPRRTIGKLAVVNPEELNGSINFFTTSGFRGTDEYLRNLQMVEEMAELKGKMVLGADWQLAVHYGRGETRNQILAKKDDPTMSPIYFAQNYESKWVGAVDSALVKINKVMELRTLTKAEHKGENNFDYVISFDVARSQSQSNNKSVITVFKLIKNKKNQIKQIHLVNILVPPNGTSFFQQTLLLKKVQVLYNAIAVVIDSNGIGSAVVDYALQETIDPATNEVYDAWATMNTDRQSDDPLAKELIFEINAQGMNTDIIVNFMDVIESGRLRLLVRENEVNTDFKMSLEELNPFIQTDLLIEELANLTLKKLPSGKYTVEQVTKKVDKDRYSALAYGLYYIVKVYEPSLVSNEAPDITKFLFIN